VHEDRRPEIFLDAMAFWDDNHGMAFGDPIDGRLVILKTHDGSRTWSAAAREQRPQTLPGEAGFAASGTCLCLQGDRVFIGLGGDHADVLSDTAATARPPRARILMSPDRGRSWQVAETPLRAGAASGIFSIAFADERHGVAVGGTYDDPADKTGNICITADGGRSWVRPASPPRGYRSCVVVVRREAWARRPRLLAIGKTGSDYSTDLGQTWKPLDNEGFYAVDCSGDGETVVAVGAEGRIGILGNPGQTLD
jgi:photosystem II stability/assembly factor-like uncharacterized protein